MGSDDAFLFDRERERDVTQEPARDRGRVFGDAWTLDFAAIARRDCVVADPYRDLCPCVDGAHGLFWLAVVGRAVRAAIWYHLRGDAYERTLKPGEPADWLAALALEDDVIKESHCDHASIPRESSTCSSTFRCGACRTVSGPHHSCVCGANDADVECVHRGRDYPADEFTPACCPTCFAAVYR